MVTYYDLENIYNPQNIILIKLSNSVEIYMCITELLIPNVIYVVYVQYYNFVYLKFFQ